MLYLLVIQLLDLRTEVENLACVCYHIGIKAATLYDPNVRSEERRVGKEC